MGMGRASFSFVLAALSVISTLGACGGDDTVFVTNGSNDLRRACDARLAWTRTKTVTCLECLTTAPLATCNCTVTAPYVGKCAQQLALRKDSPDCDDALDRCVASCSQTECGCIELCYSTRAACKVRSAALEGCVTEVCASVCQ